MMLIDERSAMACWRTHEISPQVEPFKATGTRFWSVHIGFRLLKTHFSSWTGHCLAIYSTRALIEHSSE